MTRRKHDKTEHPQEQPDEGSDRGGLEAATPHDALFHFAFVDPRHAAAELQCVLPQALSAKIDWSSLTPEQGRFVDAKLLSRYSDLLFSARIGQRRGLIYLLFEHLSSRKRLGLLTLLEYMVRIWQAHRKRYPREKRLPVILPVVLHHSETGWTAAKRFREILDVDSEVLTLLEPFIPDFQAVFDDISRVDPRALKARAMTPEGKLVLFCFRVGRTPDELVKWLPEWGDVLMAVARSPVGGLFISAVMQYLEEVTKLGEVGLKTAMQQALGNSVAEKILFAGERLIERGRREGERAVLLRLLVKRFGALPADAETTVEAATPSDLERMLSRVLTASTLEDVLGKKKRRRGATPPRS